MPAVTGSDLSSRQYSRPVTPGMLTSRTIASGALALTERRAATTCSASSTSTSTASKVVLTRALSAASSSTSKSLTLVPLLPTLQAP